MSPSVTRRRLSVRAARTLLAAPIVCAFAWAVAAGAADRAGVVATPRAPAAPQGVSQAAPFRAAVDMVRLSVTVTGSDGRYLTDLQQPEFTILEDGARQQVEFFSHATLPLALSLLLDTSASMEGKLGTAQEAAVGFARRLRAEDRAQLIDFDSRVHVTQGFTGDAGRLEAAIRATTPGGSTALYNAIYISLRELRRVRTTSESDVRRQAIIVLSDGEDTSSLVTYDEVMDLAKRSETAVYTIGLQTRSDLASRGVFEAEFVLRDLARQTGGRAFFPSRVEDLAGIYRQISEELASQYLLGYVSKNPRRDGAWRRVAVQVGRPDAEARTRLGYYGPR